MPEWIVQSLNDFKLLQISWIFDLNFKPAVKQLGQLGFIPLILSTMPDSWQLAFLGDFMKEYMVKITR